MKIRNISPYGALDVPLLRTVLEADQVIDVTEDQARVLLLQADNYAAEDRPAKTLVKALAADLTAEQDTAGADTPDGQEQDAQAPADAAATEGK